MLSPEGPVGARGGPPGQPPFDIDASAQGVLDRLWEQGHAALVVGGAVRDALLGLPTSDWDVATDARPERILEVFPGSLYENRFGTVLVRDVEVTTFRRDHHYADHRRPERITFTDDVYEDLARRDLTINAIAWGRGRPDSLPRLLDPADGLSDLRARLVRAVGDPDARFDEDALRLLRAVRVAARLDFSLEPLTYAALVAHATDVAWVSEERVGSELRQMLRADAPSRAFRMLRQTGILGVILPELVALSGQPALGGDSEDMFEHSLAVLDAATSLAPGSGRVALAALLGGQGGQGGQGAGEPPPGDGDLAAEASQGTGVAGMLRRLRISGRDAESVGRLISASQRLSEGAGWSEPDLRRFMRWTGPDLLDDLLTLRAAAEVAAGRDPGEIGRDELAQRIARERAAGTPLVLADLAVDGHDLQHELGLSEGPAVGAILERLLDAVLDDPVRNERATLLLMAGGWLGAGWPGAPHGVGSAG